MESASTIGRGTVVRGSVHGDGDLEILGRVEGSVSVTGELAIGESARIKSDVSGRRVTVEGAVAGNVSATEAIVLLAGARVFGDLGAPQFGIRPGALVSGMVSTGGPSASSAPRRHDRGSPPRAPRRREPRPHRAAAPRAALVRRARPAARPVAVASPPAHHAAPRAETPTMTSPRVDPRPPHAEPEPSPIDRR